MPTVTKRQAVVSDERVRAYPSTQFHARCRIALPHIREKQRA